MSYQAYLDNIKAQTGMTPEDFKALAKEKGLLEPGVKVGEIVTWLKKDIGLGHGHAMAIVMAIKQDDSPKISTNEKIDTFFAGGKAKWRETYDRLMNQVEKFGDRISCAPTDSYISLLKRGKKFAVIAVTADRMDIGIKLKAVEPSDRLEASGAWNAMVTHRVRITQPEQVDQELLTWLKRAYDAV